MPVTVKPSPHGARSWTGGKFRQASSPEALLAHTLMDEAPPGRGERSSSSSSSAASPAAAAAAARQLVQSSFADLRRDDRVFATKNGFVHACMEAYNEHHRLVIRPEDVWFAILTQLGSYINAHADELRDLLLVSDDDDDDESNESDDSENRSDGGLGNGSGSGSGNREGGRSRSRRSSPKRRRQQQQHQQQQQHLHIEADLRGPDGRGVDHGRMAHAMTKLMQRRFRDEDLRDWVQPAFTTTTKADQAVASVVFMGAMQRYFAYSWGTRCGIPAATLLGVESDWTRVRQRAERLARFGPEAARWLALLRPVLDGFVACFRDPEAPAARRFWQAVCDEHVPNGSGATTYSGWVTAFCFWDEAGRCLHGAAGEPVRLTRSQLPIGFTKVPVTLLDDGLAIPAEMIAGSVAMRVSSSSAESAQKNGELRNSGRPVVDTIQPEVGWFMYKT